MLASGTTHLIYTIKQKHSEVGPNFLSKYGAQMPKVDTQLQDMELE